MSCKRLEGEPLARSEPRLCRERRQRGVSVAELAGDELEFRGPSVVGPEAFPRPDTFAPPIREAYYELHDLKRG